MFTNESVDPAFVEKEDNAFELLLPNELRAVPISEEYVDSNVAEGVERYAIILEFN